MRPRSRGRCNPIRKWHHGDVAAEGVPDVELFLDDRGSLLRVTWDPETQQLMVSIWRESRCVATHGLDFADTARLSALLTQAWVDGLRSSLTEAE